MLDMLFSFRGRIGRLAWWSTTIFCFSILFFVGFAAVSVTDNALLEAGMLDPIAISFFVPIYLLTLWMSLATTVKRYHDRNKSGWWCQISLIPFGVILLYIECGFLSGSDGANSFGDTEETTIKADPVERVAFNINARPVTQTEYKQRKTGRQEVEVNQPAGTGFGRRINTPYAP